MKTCISSLILSIVVLVQAEIPGFGWCPEKKPNPGFKWGKFLGTWYQIERYPDKEEGGSRCAMTNYTKEADGKILVSDQETDEEGVMKVNKGVVVKDKFLIIVRYNTPPPLKLFKEYIILDTDYVSYSVAYACRRLDRVQTEFAWLMTRESTPSFTVLQRAYEAVDRHAISRKFVVKVNQENCSREVPGTEAEGAPLS